MSDVQRLPSAALTADDHSFVSLLHAAIDRAGAASVTDLDAMDRIVDWSLGDGFVTWFEELKASRPDLPNLSRSLALAMVLRYRITGRFR